MVGKDIDVRVIEVDRQRHRLVLSQRAAQRSIRAKQKDKLIGELYEGQVLDGTIINVRDFGAFVDLGAADGLVHVSELAWQQVDHPKNIVEPGEEVKVMVIKIDQKRQRIGLSIKQLLPSPWDSVEERLAPGQAIVGKITRVLDFGAFIDLGEGIEGLLHNSQISEEADSDIIVGNAISLKVVSLDVQRHRVSLSLANSHTDNQESIDATNEVNTDLESTHEVEADKDSSAKGGGDHDESNNQTE
jgi:small subunit ribosomal protein S1